MSDRVPTRFVSTLLRRVGDRGYDFQPMLERAGLDFNPLEDWRMLAEIRFRQGNDPAAHGPGQDPTAAR